jgi:hypothetical protein
MVCVASDVTRQKMFTTANEDKGGFIYKRLLRARYVDLFEVLTQAWFVTSPSTQDFNGGVLFV